MGGHHGGWLLQRTAICQGINKSVPSFEVYTVIFFAKVDTT